jgi:hypothetical protein
MQKINFIEDGVHDIQVSSEKDIYIIHIKYNKCQ